MYVRNSSAEASISIGSLESIIHKHLQYCKIMAQWDPKLLNFEQKKKIHEVGSLSSLAEEIRGGWGQFFNDNLPYRRDMDTLLNS